jgi:hypothetical protein
MYRLSLRSKLNTLTLTIFFVFILTDTSYRHSYDVISKTYINILRVIHTTVFSGV